MGAHLVGMVLASWSHVPDRAFRVLVRMAHTALDAAKEDQPSERYFGGRDLLALTLGQPFPPGDTDDAISARQSAYRTVRRAIEDLTKAAVVEPVGQAHAGHQPDYRLKSRGSPSDLLKGDTGGPPQGDTGGPPQGDTSGPSRRTRSDPPRNHEEPRKELEQEPPTNPTAEPFPRPQATRSTGRVRDAGARPADPARRLPRRWRTARG